MIQNIIISSDKMKNKNVMMNIIFNYTIKIRNNQL